MLGLFLTTTVQFGDAVSAIAHSAMDCRSMLLLPNFKLTHSVNPAQLQTLTVGFHAQGGKENCQTSIKKVTFNLIVSM